MKKIFVLLIVSLICIYNQHSINASAETVLPDHQEFVKTTMTTLNTPSPDGHFPASDSVSASTEEKDLRSTFLLLCDSILERINDPKSKEAYFIDSYGVRVLCVAYDMTKKQKYLDASVSWSKRMAEYQEKMIPAGVYYMNYERKPGEEKGDWFIADCSCIAMGVLTTAVRCQGSDKNYLMQSVEKYAKIVMDNYIGPSGGIINGGWSDFKGEWWCSSGLFGSLTFMLFQATGNQKYLEAGLNDIDWMNKEDLTKTRPFPLSEQGPSMPMYFLEAYTAGWHFLIKDTERKNGAVKKVEWCLDWIKDQQMIPVKERKWPPTEWWGSKFGGLPFYEFVFSKYIPEKDDLIKEGDWELEKLTEIVLSKKLYTSQLTMFMLLSYAERVSPGDLYRMKNRSKIKG